MFLQIKTTGLNNAVDLATIYGFDSIHVTRVRAGTDLDENDGVAVLKDKIDLTMSGAEVLPKELQAGAREKMQGLLFGLPAA